MTEKSKLDHALELAALGFRVFPLVPNDKEPAFVGWQAKATTDPERIERYWTDPITGWQHDWNIGIATGAGIVALDEDNKGAKRGRDSIAILEMTNDTLPPTLTSRTPTGGRHHIYKPAQPVKNSVSRIGEGLDVRGDGGYIVAPGSTIDGKPYEWERGPETPIAAAPAWLSDLMTRARPREQHKGETAVKTLDTEQAIRRAIRYLQHEAPEAVEGAGGDHTTYQVAARVKDFGVSEPTAFELMAEHWNERCAPPWMPEDLQRKVENAYRYGENAIGANSPDAEFEPVHIETDEPDTFWFDPDEDESAMPPRRFVVSRFAARGYVTGLVAAPGVGKTTFSVNMALAIAANRSGLIGLDVLEQGKVWLYNGEDDGRELRRRAKAAAKHFQIPSDLLRERLLITGSAGGGYTFAKRDSNRNLKRTSAVREVIEKIQAENIRVAIFDPLIELHEAEENHNTEMRIVMGLFREIAIKCDCAVIVVHHTRKPNGASPEGHAGSLDSARGAGSWAGNVRFAFTLMEMSEADTARYSVPVESQFDYVRLDDAKGNLTKKRKGASWFKKESVLLGNGDDVGVLAPCQLVEVTQRAEAAFEDATADCLVAHGGEASVLVVAKELHEVGERDPFLQNKKGAPMSVSTLRSMLKKHFLNGRLVGANRISYVENEGKSSLKAEPA